MNDTRLKLLRQYVEEEPLDPFNWYALAMEEQKYDLQRAEAVYQHLLSTFPDYIPAYYQSALLYIELGNHDKALDILKEGLLQCERQRNFKTKNEIQALIYELEGE